MNVSIFNMPELVISIARYLEPCDMAKMMATCKNLAQQFEPILWRNLTIWNRQLERDAILRNREYIQVLQLLGVPDPMKRQFISTILEPPMTIDIQRRNATPSTESILNVASRKITLENISRIYMEGAPYSKELSLLVGQCPRLTHLEIVFRGGLFSLGTLDSLINDVRQSSCLKYLRLEGYIDSEDIDSENLIPLLKACLLHQTLQEVYFIIQSDILTSDISTEDFSSFLDSLEDSYKSMETKSHIRSLVLPEFYEGYPVTFITALLLDYLPDLERFTFPRVRFDPPIESEEAIRGLCPKLQHLSILSTQHDNRAYSFLAECSKNFSLKTFRVDNVYPRREYMDRDIILDALSLFHSTTLEEIEITGYIYIDSRILQNILVSCRKLTRFWVSSVTDLASALDIGDIVSGEWVCHNLKELRLTLKWNEGNDLSEDDERWSELSLAYTQIRRLVKLEKLHIGYASCLSTVKHFESDFALRHGWLSKFAGLSRLREFGMTIHFWKEIGQAAVEFMNTNWPKLETIVCGGETLQSKVECSDIQEMPHWRWLRNQRPRLIMESVVEPIDD
ncbi:hypothetical protein BGZ49_006122 [Haplosporangium sp. Z 27]|nr:hypothetical protein BGZ49_006122 [Haplosporangium sp. Z 27]